MTMTRNPQLRSEIAIVAARRLWLLIARQPGSHDFLHTTSPDSSRRRKTAARTAAIRGARSVRRAMQATAYRGLSVTALIQGIVGGQRTLNEELQKVQLRVN